MTQLALDFLDLPASPALAEASAPDRGAVYTRREVVEFILDLAGYTTDQPLPSFRLLEPSVGDGDFLVPVVERLLVAYRAQGGTGDVVADLTDAICAVEIHPESATGTRDRVRETLRAAGVGATEAEQIMDAWIRVGDFLLVDLPHRFTHVVGNPPYVRPERIPAMLLAEYRRRFGTMYDRADLYVPFLERSLSHLEPGGALGFICSDRWMKNRYGGPLRALVASGYHLAYYIDMVDVPAFHAEVIAYPAITIIRRERPGPTRMAHQPLLERSMLSTLAEALRADRPAPESGVQEVAGVIQGSEPWMLRALDTLPLVRRLEAAYPALEEAGCRVGIGVATGADKVYIGPFDALDVEPDRKLPLVKPEDIRDGTVRWRGLGVINPFAPEGGLVDLAAYPRLARYLEQHREAIQRRNVARKNPRAWFRTIDRIFPELVSQPKLLIPDIKGWAHVAFDEGRYYPHHNLYFVTSEVWDLRALQAVLRSAIATLFVSTYSVHMAGGYLRFQAQYLRRIRLPHWSDVPEDVRERLVTAAVSGRPETCNAATYDLYRLTPAERALLGEEGDGRA